MWYGSVTASHRMAQLGTYNKTRENKGKVLKPLYIIGEVLSTGKHMGEIRSFHLQFLQDIPQLTAMNQFPKISNRLTPSAFFLDSKPETVILRP